jgi:S-disulfanyl-L-cysteine oxidoreductase SoxD
VKAMQTRIGIAAAIGLAAIGLAHSAPRAQESAQATRSVWDGVYTAEQAKRGAEQYSKVCARCHGEDLAGIGEAAPLTGSGFLANWDGLTLGDLAERVSQTMPQDNPGHLTRQQVADIITHLLSFDGFPAGKTELDPKIEVQKQIRIDASKPAPKSSSESSAR